MSTDIATRGQSRVVVPDRSPFFAQCRFGSRSSLMVFDEHEHTFPPPIDAPRFSTHDVQVRSAPAAVRSVFRPRPHRRSRS